MKCIVVVLVLYASLEGACQVDNIRKSFRVVSRSNWNFTNAAYASIAKAAKPSDSFLFSPLSVQVIMAVCYMGARGDTAKQMSKALGLPNRPCVIKAGFRRLIRILKASRKVSLVTANKVYPAATYPILKTFLSATKSYFSADVENLDYRYSSKAAKTINGWVRKATHSKIKDVVDAKSLNPSTVLLLVNTVYFKGDWDEPFGWEDTYPATFYVDGKVRKQFPTMHTTRKFGFKEYKEIGAKVLELNYKDKGDTSLLIVLPTKRDGLSDVEAKLTKVDLNGFVLGSKFKQKELRVSLPKFTLTYSTRIEDVLSSLGMKDVFGARADLTGMTSRRGMFVDNVLHKAMIEVNEVGTVAAAATSVEAGFRRHSPTAVDFVVDHPFVFVLVSRRAKVVVFAGRFTGVAPAVGRTKDLGEGEWASSSSSSLIGGASVLSALMMLIYKWNSTMMREFHLHL